MAALICILRGLPKDARVASFRFLKILQRYRNSTKTLHEQYYNLQGSPKIWGLATGLLVGGVAISG